MLAEHEVLDRLKTELRSLANDCLLLAHVPARGPVYKRFRQSVKVVEGHFRLMAYYRNNDARWLPYALTMGVVHKQAGGWLRRYARTENSNVAQPLFLELAEFLLHKLAEAERLETAATGRIGAILPKPRSEVRTAGRPMQVMLPSGLIVPSEYA